MDSLFIYFIFLSFLAFLNSVVGHRDHRLAGNTERPSSLYDQNGHLWCLTRQLCLSLSCNVDPSSWLRCDGYFGAHANLICDVVTSHHQIIVTTWTQPMKSHLNASAGNGRHAAPISSSTLGPQIRCRWLGLSISDVEWNAILLTSFTSVGLNAVYLAAFQWNLAWNATAVWISPP